MYCKFAVMKSETIRTIDAGPSVIQNVFCKLKMKGQAEQLKVYGRLFELGLEHAAVSDVCPVAATDKWAECPFRREE